MSIEAQSVVIIGGSSGIGLAIAKEAVDAGAEVTIAGRSQNRLDEARRAIAGDIAVRTVDLSNERSVRELFAQTGELDHLVITGGSVKTGPLRELAFNEARAGMDEKFWGQYLAARYAKVRSPSSPVFSVVVRRRERRGWRPSTERLKRSAARWPSNLRRCASTWFRRD